MVYERGPIEPAPFPRAAPVITPNMFLALGGELVAALTAGDGQLGAHVATLAPLLSRELGSSYAADVAPASAAIDALGQVGDALELAGIVAAVDATAGDLEQVRADLPNPNGDDEPAPVDPGGEPPGGGQD